MIELLVGAMAGTCAWVVANCVPHRDRLVVARVAVLRPDEAMVPPKRRRIGDLLAAVGRTFPGKSSETHSEPGTGSASESLRGAQVLGGVSGFIFGLLSGPLALVVSPALGAIGYRLPQFLQRRRIVKRKEQAAAALPEAVDLLAVCAHAGLNISLSLKRVAARSRGVLGEELSRTLEEIELGVARQVAMRSLAERNPGGDLEALVRVLENSERFGTQVSASLETFAQEVRSRRRRAAEEQARRAPIKILFPLVFLILPAFVLLSVVPLLLSTFTSLGF